MVFDEDRAARYARTARNLRPGYSATIEHDVVADIAATATPTGRILRAGDIPSISQAGASKGCRPPRTGLTPLAGKEASYTRFVALGMAGSIHTGVPWMGKAVEPGGVPYLSGEGRVGFARRIDAWRAAHGHRPKAIRVLPPPVDSLDAAALASLASDIAALEIVPAVIIVDTLARNDGGDENATADMGRFVEARDRLKRRTGAQVTIVHHPNTNGEIRGNTALVGAVDTRMDARRDGAIVALTRPKRDDWAGFAPLELTVRPLPPHPPGPSTGSA